MMSIINNWKAEQKTILSFCTFKYYPHLCSAFHFEQAERFANFAVGIFYAYGSTISSDPRVER